MASWKNYVAQEKSAQMYGLDPSLGVALYAQQHQQQIHNQIVWQWLRKKLAEKKHERRKEA